MSHEISHQQSREEDDLGNHFEKRPKRDQGERISRPPERKSLDLVKQEATRAEGKKHEGLQKEHIDAYVKEVLAIFKYLGGIFNNMSVQGVEEFMAKGAEYGGWLRLMSREDIQDLNKMVQQDKLSLSHFCPADIEALREMEEAARVEAGQGRGKDHFEPWIGHRACNEYGKPVARTVHLATESTPEKPILPGKGYNGPFDNTFRDSLSLSDAKIRKLRAGKDISTVLSPYEYQQYQKKYGQSSASSQRQGPRSESERQVSDSESERQVSDSESERQVSDSESERDEGYSLNEQPRYNRDSGASSQLTERKSMSHGYFDEQYECDPIPGKSLVMVNIRRGTCVFMAAMCLLHDQGVKNITGSKVAADILYYGEGNASPLALVTVLEKYGKVPYVSIEPNNTSIDNLRNILDRCGHSLVAAVHNQGKPPHVIVIDKITDTDVIIRDTTGYGMIPRYILKNAAHGYLVPA